MVEKVTFAKRLREGMDSVGMSAAELARKSGISKSSISHYLKGDWEGKQDAVYLIAKALNVSEAWLMGFDVSKQRKPAANSGNGRSAEFAELFNRLTPEQQDFIIASIKGLLQAQ